MIPSARSLLNRHRLLQTDFASLQISYAASIQGTTDDNAGEESQHPALNPKP